RALPQRCGLGPPRISHAAGTQLCVGADAHPRARLVQPEGECAHWLIALPQSGTSGQAQAAVSVPQCLGPGNRGFCPRPTADAADSGLRGWGLCNQGHAATLTRSGRRGLADAEYWQALCTASPPDRSAPGVSAQERRPLGVAQNLGAQTVRLA